ncbi:MAG: class III signal peptide-containing protein [archaeon]|jgi:uncharacterized protein (UPF0333 family)
MDFNINKAQGAIEYLLLIGAAIIVVGIVVTAMIQTVGPAKETGNIETYNYICNTLNSNQLDCGCYLGTSKGGATKELCCAKSESILKEKWNC